MKQLFFTGVSMLAIATTCSAQYNETIFDQQGSYNKAGASQIGSWHITKVKQNGWGDGSALNLTDQYQNGSLQYSEVNQSGRGHAVNSTQTGTQANWAYFDQYGYNMRATSTQTGASNYIKANQSGFAISGGGDAYFEQTGYLNRAELTQYATSGAVGRSMALIRQIGNSNFGSSSQSGDANKSSISQYDSWNRAYTAQGNSLPYSTSNRIEINQTGVGATSWSYNYAKITQDGNRNDALANQTGRSNTINLEVYGNGNSANLLQNGTNHVVRGINGDGVARQWGNNNQLYSSQTGNNQTLSVMQNGSFNVASAIQSN